MHVTKDFLSGLMFMAFGVGTAVIGSSYALGSPAGMGPGYFPVLLGCTITVIGAIVAGRALLWPQLSELVGKLGLRPLACVLLAILCFGLLIQSSGLVASVAALLLVSRFSHLEGSALELILMLVILTAVPVLIFVYGLGLPFRVWLF